MHVVLVAVSPDQTSLDEALGRARNAYGALRGVVPIWRQDHHALASGREPFGFRDSISHPAIEGSGFPGTNSHERPLEREFLLGYPDETGGFPPMPHPDIRAQRDLRGFSEAAPACGGVPALPEAGARSAEEEEVLAAKMMGRWRSGAPLAICPHRDDPALGGDPERNNDFVFADDPVGYQCPPVVSNT